MIYECQGGHISFSKDDLNTCGMRGCNKSTVIISPIDMREDLELTYYSVALITSNLARSLSQSS